MRGDDLYQLPADLQPVPAEKPFDVKRRLSPYNISGDIKYKWAPKWMDVAEGSWAATPHTYLAFSGRTEYGDNSRVPFHLTTTDFLESDRLLVELMGAFHSVSTPIDIGGFGTFDGVLTKAFWNPHIEGQFSGEHMRAWDVDWGRGTGKAVIENNYADITDGVFFGHYPGSRIDTAGRYSLGYPRKDHGREIDARINVQRWPLVELRHAFYMDLWPVDGLGSAELHLYGEYERPDGFGSLRIDNGSAWEESFDYATADLRFEHAGVRVDGIELHKSTGIVRGAAFADWHSETYSFNADGQRIPVESIDNSGQSSCMSSSTTVLRWTMSLLSATGVRSTIGPRSAMVRGSTSGCNRSSRARPVGVSAKLRTAATMRSNSRARRAPAFMTTGVPSTVRSGRLWGRSPAGRRLPAEATS